MNTEITKAKRWEAREWCVCIFTFGGDAVALGQCIRALKRLRARCLRAGGDLSIYVFDDGKHPLPYAPAGVMYEKTWFERGGNLNGVACVQGELVCMLKAVKASGAKYVVKLDSDTVVQDLGWMMEAFEEDEAYVEHVGVSLNNEMDWASGVCYGLRESSLEQILRQACSIKLRADVPEDVGITQVVGSNMFMSTRLVDMDGYCEGYKDVLVGYDYQNVRGSWAQWQVYAMSAVVTFGNRNFIKDKARQREIVGREMEKFNDVLEGGCGGLADGEAPVEAFSIEEAEAAMGKAINRGKLEDYKVTEELGMVSGFAKAADKVDM